jgi:hypothetical protein
MAGSSTKNSNNSTNTSSSTTTQSATQLPGVNNSQVIVSSPNLIKENSQNSTVKK